MTASDEQISLKKKTSSLSQGYTFINLFIPVCALRHTFKPIFHCDAKPFALGTFALPNPKYTNMLVSFALGDANFSRHPTQNPNASQWNIGCIGSQTQNLCVGHVHFMIFVSISFAFCSQRRPSFQWNVGFRVVKTNGSSL